MTEAIRLLQVRCPRRSFCNAVIRTLVGRHARRLHFTKGSAVYRASIGPPAASLTQGGCSTGSYLFLASPCLHSLEMLRLGIVSNVSRFRKVSDVSRCLFPSGKLRRVLCG